MQTRRKTPATTTLPVKTPPRAPAVATIAVPQVREDDDGYAADLQRAMDETRKSRKAVLLLVDTSVDLLNRFTGDADRAHEGAADHLFRTLLDNDALLAFAHESKQPGLFLLVRRRAGASLDIEGTDLDLHVRIGALNHIVREDGWQKLRWSKKCALVPLVQEPGDLRLLRAGIRQAVRLNVGVRALKSWVRQQLKELDTLEPAAQSGPTVATGRRIVKAAQPLSREQRAVLVRRVAEASPEVREEIVRAMKQLAQDAADFVREVEDYPT